MRALLLWIALLGLACQSRLLHDVDESSANQAVAALEAAGIDAYKHKSQGGFQLDVASAEEGRALEVLRVARLPRELAAPPCPDALLPSPEAEDEARRARLAAQLARELESIPGVIEARVIVAAPRAAPLGESLPAPGASVVYRYRGSPPDEATLRGILVAALGGVEGAQLSLVGVEAPPVEAPSPFAYVGPFAVAPGSARALWYALLGAGMLLLALASVAGALWLRLRRTP